MRISIFTGQDILADDSARFVNVHPAPVGFGQSKFIDEFECQIELGRAADKRLMAVLVQIGATFDAGTPAALFRVEVPADFDRYDQYDVTADGQRFLVNTTVAEANRLPLTTVVNWTRDLKR